MLPKKISSHPSQVDKESRLTLQRPSTITNIVDTLLLRIIDTLSTILKIMMEVGDSPLSSPDDDRNRVFVKGKIRILYILAKRSGTMGKDVKLFI